MKVNVHKKGHVNVLECSGTFRFRNDMILTKAMDELLDAHERFYVFDMRKVPWIDTGGLAEIIAAHKHVTDKEGKIILVLNDKLRQLFTITQLVKVFETYDDLEEALGSFAN